MTLFNSTSLNSSSGPGTSTIAASAFVFALTLQGTGSSYDASSLAQWRQYVQPRVPVQIGEDDGLSSTSDAVDVRSAADHLKNIRSELDPSISDMAHLFEVSRQMVYKWMAGGSEPRAATMQRIQALSQTADRFSEAQLDRPGSLLKLKAFDGKCLLDLLKEDADIQEPVQALIAEARKMDAAYRESGLADTKASPSSDWQSYVSVPGSIDHS